MDRFIANGNIKRFREQLDTEADAGTRTVLQKLLVEEEDKLGASVELLADIDRHIAEGHTRIEKQELLVLTMERDGHGGLALARALLDRMRETLSLHHRYRARLLIDIRLMKDRL